MRVVVACFYFAFLCVVLLLDGEFFNKPKSDTILGLDKTIHFFLFFIFSFLCHKAFERKRKINHSPSVLLGEESRNYNPRHLYLATFIALFVAVISEPLQGVLTLYRSADYYDFLFDVLGVVVYFLLAFFFSKRKAVTV